MTLALVYLTWVNFQCYEPTVSRMLLSLRIDIYTVAVKIKRIRRCAKSIYNWRFNKSTHPPNVWRCSHIVEKNFRKPFQTLSNSFVHVAVHLGTGHTYTWKIKLNQRKVKLGRRYCSAALSIRWAIAERLECMTLQGRAAPRSYIHVIASCPAPRPSNSSLAGLREAAHARIRSPHPWI